MPDGPRLDAANTNLGLMSDEDIYDLYLKAVGFSATRSTRELQDIYDDSRSKRLLTVVDAIVYVLFLTVGMMPSVRIPPGVLIIPLIGAMTSLLNITSGVFAWGGAMSFMRSHSAPIEPPSRDEVNLRAPEVLATVSEYLTRPLLANSKLMVKQHRGELEMIQRLIGQAQMIATRLQQEKTSLTSASLAPSYENRIAEACETIKSLEEKRNLITSRIEKIENETAPLEQQVNEMRLLAKAGEHLRSIKDMADDFTTIRNGDSGRIHDEEVALESFAQISARVELARQNLADVGATVRAYEDAIAEVRRLTTSG